MKIGILTISLVSLLAVINMTNAEGLPANPWTKTAGGNESAGRQLEIQHTETVAIDYNAAPELLLNRPRRQIGAVGKISAPIQRTKSSQSDQTDISSTITDMFTDDSENPESPQQTQVSTSQMPEIKTDFSSEYEKLKRQGLNKWDKATAPFKAYYKKWRQALQETSEMDLKDFMP